MMREACRQQLWIGNARDIRDLRMVSENGITAVVDLAIEEPPAVLLREMLSFRVPLIDGAGNSAASLQLAVQTVSMLVRLGVPTVVACSGGMSRSPAIAAAALSLANGTQLTDELRRIAQSGPADVHPGLLAEILGVHASMCGGGAEPSPSK